MLRGRQARVISGLVRHALKPTSSVESQNALSQFPTVLGSQPHVFMARTLFNSSRGGPGFGVSRGVENGMGTRTALNYGVRIIPERTAMVVERFGKYNRTLESGIHLLIPVVSDLDSHQMLFATDLRHM